MAEETLSKLLGNAQLSALVDATGLTPLTQPVSALGSPWHPPARLSGEATVDSPWRGLAIGASAGVELAVGVHPVGEALQVALGLEERLERLEPRPGHALAGLHLGGRAGLKGSGSAVSSGVKISASGEVLAAMELAHVLEVPGGQVLASALGELVARSRLPFAVEPGFFDGSRRELFLLKSRLGLDLSAKVETGTSGSLGVELFHGLGAQVRADYQAALSASLGLALYEEMAFSVGTLVSSQDGWLRVVLERVHQQRLTLGATASLQVKYDAGSALVAALEHLLELKPVAELIDLADQLSALAGAAAGADWPTVKARLGEKLTNRLVEALELDRLADDLARSELAGKLLAAAGKIVETYKNLGQELQSLLDRALAGADLEAGSKLRRALEDIARLGSADTDAKRDEALAQLVGEQASQSVALLEALTGVDLESLVLGSEPFERVTWAARQAQSGLEFLDSLPKELVARLQKFLEKKGIAGVLEDLEGLNDAASLEKLVEKKLRSLVERLVGKALAMIDDEDVARLQAWAKALHDRLEAAKKGIDELKERLAKLEGEVGFSLGLELELLSRRSALLDAELELSKTSEWRRAYAQLQAGSVSGFLAELAAVAQDAEEPEAVPYRLRAAVLSSRRVRSTAVSLFASFLGLTSQGRQRIEEERVEVDGAAGAEERRARYAGGFLRHEKAEGASWSAGTWLVIRGRGQGLRLDDPYDREFQPGLRFTVSRRDDATTAEELQGLGFLLESLGFHGAASALAAVPQAPKLATRLGIALEAGQEGLQAWFDSLRSLSEKQAFDDAGWNQDFRSAARRWLDDPLEVSTLTGRPELRRGPVLAAVVGSQEFADRWRNLLADERGFSLTFAGTPVNLDKDFPEVKILKSLSFARSQGVKRLLPVVQAFAALSQPPTPSECQGLVHRFPRAAAGCDPTLYGSPEFLLWLAQAGLTRLDRAGDGHSLALDTFRGLATVRWRRAGEEQWHSSHFRLGASGLAEARLLV
ncbi:MAG: hypothetical protein U0002_21750 [Thermoanaerobaculia bacterium]